MNKKKATVVGAGILGIAASKTLSEMGFQVTVIEKNNFAKNSSIRNFGMVWPIGQHYSNHLDRALKSRNTWIDLCNKGKIWNNPCGSIQLFTNEIEIEMAIDFFESNLLYRPGLKLLSKSQCLELLPIANGLNVLGGLYSDTEVIVESRNAIKELPNLLKISHDIEFIFGKTVIEASQKHVKTTDGSVYENDIVFICNGHEINLLFPNFFENAPITISQLNMMRSKPVDAMIPAVCGGLSFLHYDAYNSIKSLSDYRLFCQEKYPNQVKHGIHLLVSQNEIQEFTIGDSHEYSLNRNYPFQENQINHYILDYYNKLFTQHDLQISQYWMGEYLKMTNGKSDWIEEIEPGVFIFNGPGGAGMTLGFGMADEAIPTLLG